MKFRKGDKVKGLIYELKDKLGIVHKHISHCIVLVKFKGIPIVVATTIHNLKLI